MAGRAINGVGVGLKESRLVENWFKDKPWLILAAWGNTGNREVLQEDLRSQIPDLRLHPEALHI